MMSEATLTRLRTSFTHPLAIAQLAVPGGGALGITFCPGKHQEDAMTGAWARDLESDLEAIYTWGAGTILTLVTQAELKALEVETLGDRARAFGMRWLHLPILDVSVPTPAWEERWAIDGPSVHAELDRGGKVLVHCKGGLGRAGLVAARILIERGLEASTAIERVREVRPGAIETAAQEAYLLGLLSARGEGEDRDAKIEFDRAGPAAPAGPDGGRRSLARSRGGRRSRSCDRRCTGNDAGVSARDSQPWHAEITGGGPFRLPAGVWTDDTAMALALADSLAGMSGLDERDLMTRFSLWRRRGDYSPLGRCFDIGVTTSRALVKFEATGDPIAGMTDPTSAGNGSLMRLSPVAVFHRDNLGAAIDAARRQSATTHGAPECLEACAFFAGLLVRAINGEAKERNPRPDGLARRGQGRRDRRGRLAEQGAIADPLQRLCDPLPRGGAVVRRPRHELRGGGGHRGQPRRRRRHGGRDHRPARRGDLGRQRHPGAMAGDLAWRARLEVAAEALLGRPR